MEGIGLGFGIIVFLVGVLIAIMPFIALMCCWSNTGETAKYTKMMWELECEIRGRNPKNGKCIADTNRPLTLNG